VISSNLAINPYYGQISFSNNDKGHNKFISDYITFLKQQNAEKSLIIQKSQDNESNNKPKTNYKKNLLYFAGVIAIGALGFKGIKAFLHSTKDIESFVKELSVKKEKIAEITEDCRKTCSNKIKEFETKYLNLLDIKNTPFNKSEIESFQPTTLSEWFNKEEKTFQQLDEWFTGVTEESADKSKTIYQFYRQDRDEIAGFINKKVNIYKENKLDEFEIKYRI